MSRSDMIGSVIDRINKVIDRFSASNTTSKALHMGALLLAFNAMSMVAASVAAAQTADVRPIKIVAFGDSLSAGFQLAPSAAFPQVLGKALAAKGYNVDVINASVSGDTTAAGRDRLDWSMPPDADAVILELGANDALRALDPAKARANIEAIIATLKARKIDVLLGGMLAPRSLGEPYTKAFDAIYPELAAKYDLPLYPFFIDKIAFKPKLNLADGMHPNAKGVEAIVADILPKVEELIGRVRARRLAAAKQ